MKIKKEIFVYPIFLILALLGGFLLWKSQSEKDEIIGLINLIFFGGGGLIYFFINNNFSGKKVSLENTETLYESKKKLLFALVGGIIFMTSGILMVIYSNYFAGQRIPPEFLLFIGIVCVVFFGLMTIFLAIKLLKPPRKLIVFSSSTIKFQVGLMKDEMVSIPIDEVLKIEQRTISSNTIISLFVDHPEHYKTDGFLSKANSRMTGTTFNISVNNTNYSGEEILKFLHQHLILSTNYDK